MTCGDDILHEIRCGRKPLTPEIAERIVRRYPQIDRTWLTTGAVGNVRK